jgi:acyl-[acyl-carrier-protein]-phospholipid O-acyltransferase/long-chain-fatty-acid--[acyl-carrier-protein] ligase
VIQPPKDGWHDTGDIIAVDRDGFVSIAGRAGRFAKIGGEMVSLDAVETIARDASAETAADHAVLLKQDPQDGDSLVLFTTDAAMKRERMVKTAQGQQKSILGLPRDKDIFVLSALPKLPTGKTDYVTLKKMLLEDFAQAAGSVAAPASAPAPQPTAQKPAP